jgi:PQQ-dependent catabolism-associated beta-propeller protein
VIKLTPIAVVVAAVLSTHPPAGKKPRPDHATSPRPSPEKTLVFVSNERAGTVTVIDAGREGVVDTIRVGTRPRGIHVSRDGQTLYVATSDTRLRTQGSGDAIVAIDIASRRVRARFDAGSDPEQFAISPDGRWLFSANEDAGTASITDVGRRTIVATLAVGIEPEGVAISPDGLWVYVTAETSNTVSVIDTRRKAVAANFMVDARPRAAAFSPDGALAYVTAEIGGTLCLIDARRHRVIKRVRLPGAAKPVGIAVSPDGRRVYVANGHGHAVSVLDAQGALLRTIGVGRRPWNLVLNADGSRLYVANGLSHDVSVVDTLSGSVLKSIAVDAGPWGIAIRSASSVGARGIPPGS